MKGKTIDITGQKFNKLTVIEYLGLNKNHQSLWRCKCDCGNETVSTGVNIRSGHTKSCGCSKKNTLKKHGLAYHPIYKAWLRMKQRCDNPSMERYQRYGGRGITYCEEWKNFENFYKWALENGWQEGLSLDRIQNDGNYEPLNCRWADRITQQNNTSINHIIEYNGKKYTIAELARETGVNYELLARRIRDKWEIKRAVETPLQMAYSHH